MKRKHKVPLTNVRNWLAGLCALCGKGVRMELGQFDFNNLYDRSKLIELARVLEVAQ